MANTASASKRNRQAHQRRDRNVQVRTGMKSAVKKVREALDKGDTAGASTLLKQAERTIGKAGSKGVVHKNAVARKISRLAHAVAKASRPA